MGLGCDQICIFERLLWSKSEERRRRFKKRQEGFQEAIAIICGRDNGSESGES